VSTNNKYRGQQADHVTNLTSSKSKRKKSKELLQSFKKNKLFFPILFVFAFAVLGTSVLLVTSASPVSIQTRQSSNLVYSKQLTSGLAILDKRLQKSPNPELENQYNEMAEQRKASIKQLLEEKKVSEVLSILNTDGFKKTPSRAVNNIERRVSIKSGTLRLDHGHDFKEDNGTTDEHNHKDYDYFYIEKSDGKKQRIHLSKEPDEKFINKKVSAQDVAEIDDTLIASTDALTLDIQQIAESLAPATTRKVAAIMFNFADTPTQPFTPTQVKSAVFENTGTSANTYYQEASYNKVGLAGIKDPTGDVFGWVTINVGSSTCDYRNWALAADNAVKSNGVDLSAYNNIAYFFPRVAACQWGGLGSVSGPSSINSRTWMNGTISPKIIIHELGHNYGAWHASSYRCTENGIVVSYSSTTANCTISEYGDPYDVMGGSSRHLNTNFKTRQAYLPTTNMQTIAGSGTYSLQYQQVASSNIQSLRVPAVRDSTGKTTQWYYIEYRQPYGAYDNFTSTSEVVNGLTIRLGGDIVSSYNTRLLDMNPATASFLDAPLPFGRTFTDAKQNMQITAVSAANGVASVKVDYSPPACLKNDPTYTIAPITQWGNPGDTLKYTITIKNNDSPGCAADSFTVSSIAFPSGFSQTPSSVTTSSMIPGATSSVTINVTSSSSQPAGFYTFTENIKRVSDSTAIVPYKVTANYNVNQVVTEPTAPPVVTISSPLNNSQVTGKKFSVRAYATSSVGISKLEVFVDGTLKTSVTGSTLNYSWNTVKLSPGSHTITVKATDIRNQSSSQTITVFK
jgi:hypothetical protein